MPNWVYNSVSVSGGTPDQIKSFWEKASTPRPDTIDDNKEIVMREEGFSFWNFIAPPQEAVESGEYFGTNGWQDGKKVGDTPNNWYEWNNEHWNTKWDACDPSYDLDDSNLSIHFSTAWSIPYPVFEAMVQQHPELHFSFYSEEEQGWGAEYSGDSGYIELVKEWDIPNSHADYEALDRDCWGCESGDPDDLYDDCPRPDEERPEPDLVY